MTIKIVDHADIFAENKDVAKHLRVNYIIPTYTSTTDEIVLDFEGVDSASQSFVHALISELLQEHGPSALKRIVFQKCNPAVKSQIGTVVNYSLE